MYGSVLTMKTEVAIGYTQEPIINKSILLKNPTWHYLLKDRNHTVCGYNQPFLANRAR